MKTMWKSNWSLKCPNKIKTFIWNACKNIPTKTCLRDRHILIEVDGGLCESIEMLEHTFWTCDLSREVWTFLAVKSPSPSWKPKDFKDLFWVLKEENNHAELEVLAIVVWGIWNSRNEVKHDATSKTTIVIVNNVRRYMEEYKQVVDLPASRPTYMPTS